MEQKERLDYLIHYLIKESKEYNDLELNQLSMVEKAQVLRSLMNLRPPIPVKREFLEIQDLYLSEEIRKRGVVDSGRFVPIVGNKRLYLWQGDITRLKVDAIVNAANASLLGCFIPQHSCIDNMIHSFSGVQLRLACNKIMQAQGKEEAVGAAKITLGYNLPCKFILHTVGPTITGKLQKRDCILLKSCYQSCLELAEKNEIHSIAFCCISTGVFHFPQKRAAEIAIETVSQFLKQNQSIHQVIFNVFTDKDQEIYQELLKNQESFQ